MSLHVRARRPCSGSHLTLRARMHAGKLFPYEPMHQWLSYGGSDRAADAFSKREFSFTLANDVYIRSAPRAPPPCPAGPRAAALRTPRGTD